MNQEYNKRTYAIIPAAKADQYIKSNFENARKSLDGKFMVWDQTWDAQTLEALRKDKDIKLLNHQAALALMNTPNWSNPEE